MNKEFVAELSRQLTFEIPEAAHESAHDGTGEARGIGGGFLVNVVRSKILSKLVGDLPDLIQRLVTKDAVLTTISAALDAIPVVWAQVILKAGTKDLILKTVGDLYDRFAEDHPPTINV